MDEREANIDLLFRNGLKDYEVLPPQDAWNNIQPVVRKNAMPFILLRAAAIVTLLLSISVLAYMLNRQTSASRGDLASFNISKVDPIHLQPLQSVLIPKTNNQKYIANLPAEVIMMTVAEAEGSYSAGQVEAQPEDVNVLTEGRADKIGSLNTASIGKSEVAGPVLTASVPVFYPETKAVPAERWSVAAMASPTYFSEFGSKGLEGSIHNSEKAAVSYSGGFAVSYRINKRFSVQTGLYYASNGQKIDGIASFGGFGKYYYSKGSSNFEVKTSSGPIMTSNPDVFLIDNSPVNRVQTAYTNDVFDPNKSSLNYISNSVIQNFSYLEMPIVLKYKIIDKMLDINIIGGFSYDILLNNSVYAKSDGGKYEVGKTEGMSNLNLSSSLGMGMEYSLSKKISLNLEPTFRYFLNPLNVMSNPAIHPYSFGVFSGFSYRF
jgi:hypothetical protein